MSLGIYLKTKGLCLSFRCYSFVNFNICKNCVSQPERTGFTAKTERKSTGGVLRMRLRPRTLRPLDVRPGLRARGCPEISVTWLWSQLGSSTFLVDASISGPHNLLSGEWPLLVIKPSCSCMPMHFLNIPIALPRSWLEYALQNVVC